MVASQAACFGLGEYRRVFGFTCGRFARTYCFARRDAIREQGVCLTNELEQLWCIAWPSEYSRSLYQSPKQDSASLTACRGPSPCFNELDLTLDLLRLPWRMHPRQTLYSSKRTMSPLGLLQSDFPILPHESTNDNNDRSQPCFVCDHSIFQCRDIASSSGSPCRTIQAIRYARRNRVYRSRRE